MLKHLNINLDSVFWHALATGGEFAELFYENTTQCLIYYEDQKIDRISSGTDAGIGLRVIYGTQSVYGYTTELSEKGLTELADTLGKVVAGKVKKDGVIALAAVKPGYVQAIKRWPSELAIRDKVSYLVRADKAAREACLDTTQVSSAYIETLRRIEVANSLGEWAEDKKQYLTFFVEMVGSRDGQMQTAREAKGGFVGLELFDEHPPESIAREAARRLNALLSAKPAPAGTMPVVLSAEAGGTMVHEAVGHGLEADLACNGLSVYAGKIGQIVASPLVTVVDDSTMPGRRGSYGVDDEGTPSQKNVLIEKGILKGYMTDRLSHLKWGLPFTGNGRRESYRHKPIVRMSNTYVESGATEPDSILATTAKGIFVKSMGGGQVNTVTGDFVFAITEGYLIQDGELGPAVKGATLSGNGPDVLRKVDRIGSDLGFAIGTCGKDGQGAPVTDAQPTLRVPELVVGGEVPMSKYWP